MTKVPQISHSIRKLRELVLAMPQARSVSSLLNLLIQKYVEDPSLALTQIWIIRPGDQCGICPLREDCLDQTRCLHLVEQGFGEGAEPSEVEMADQYTRIPLGLGKLGKCAVTGKVEDVEAFESDLGYVVSEPWARRVNALGMAVLPVIYQGRVLGVNSFVAKAEVDLKGEGLFWGRLVADYLAVSIINAEAFEKIEGLNQQLAEENEYLGQELVKAEAYGEIIGQSPSIKNVARQIEMVADTDASVLITGESGTGKELVAREVHKRSSRSNRPFIKLNCASVPRELYESEFFGHLRGSFTGAIQDRKGRFELADGGTLFLDEVGEIPLEVQSKLLRVLQEGEFERVGDESTRKVDVRILAATNRDLKQEVKEGRFREDLFYRLNIFPIESPPLRERMEDLPLLAKHFVDLASRKFNKTVKHFPLSKVAELNKYDWPGNIREFQNLIERAVITSKGGRLEMNLPQPKAKGVEKAGKAELSPDDETVFSEKEMKQREQENILRALTQSHNKIYGVDGAAHLLGIKPTTLATRIRAMGLKKTYSPK